MKKFLVVYSFYDYINKKVSYSVDQWDALTLWDASKETNKKHHNKVGIIKVIKIK